MADSETLKEFLVKLGWKNDDAAKKKVDLAVSEITKSINALGIAIDLSLAAMVAFTVKSAEALDKLYFASQRTGSAVENIQAFDYATAQMGGSADGAQASLENLAHFIRSYPGSENFLERIGVKPEHVHDAVKAMGDLGKTFQHMPFWQAQLYGNMLGIDEKTLLAMQSGKLNQWMDDYKSRLADVGLSETDAAKSGNEFMTAIRGLEAETGIAGEALVNGPFGKALIWCVEWLDKVARGAALTFQRPMNFVDGLAADSMWAAGLNPDGTPLGKGTSSSGGAREDRQNNPGNLRSWGSVPVINGFASFGSKLEGLTAEARQLLRYNTRGIHTINDIVDKWAPASDGNNTAAYKKFLSGWMHSDINKPLDLNDQSTLESMMSGISRYEQGSLNRKDKGLYDQAAASALGAHVTQTTTIQVTGNDPQAIATAVAARQNDVNNSLVRNVQGAVR